LIRKVQEINNKSHTLFITIPKEYEEKLGISKSSEVKLEMKGKILQVEKAVIL
jgi:antitoxin component of MazEF toxin-antitoxin module